MTRFTQLQISFLILFCMSCSQTNNATLYDRMGGQVAIDNIVKHVIQNIGRDEVVFDYFSDSNVTRFQKMLALHLCEVTDGPCKYNGDSMKDIHTGMNITESHFNHVVEILISAMDSSGIPYPLQNELLKRLAPLRADIIKI
ncbi:group I truncated hemoglobin [Pseudocolwellia sp. HL-MZ19]|uniref:group I truncated hemoglobin n=1 Tax=unclassified Pseudocolwellia TaxID=2848178 RepID=UPI003CF3B968